MSPTATLTPEAPQAQPVRERRCGTCGVRSRFLEGFEPDWSGWVRGCCRACSIQAAWEAARNASREEQEQLVLAARGGSADL